jgi:hypothetical protein
MDSNINIISKQKTLLKDRIKKVKNSVHLNPIDFEHEYKLNSFEMGGKIVYLQY